MADPSAEAKIRDLERRLDLDPGSRLFVSLAEEYRKLGRFKQALSALQKGLLAHPGYIAAQVALGRVYLESGQNTDAIATFTKVLVADPGNLVAAKSLADVYFSRGDKLEALKKYKLYRALAGDRKVDEVIAQLETEVAPRPITPSRVVPKAEPPPPPPSFQETDKGKRRTTFTTRESPPPPRHSDAFDITSVAFEPGEDTAKGRIEEPFPFVPTRDMSLAPDLPPPPAAPTPIETAGAVERTAPIERMAPIEHTAPIERTAPVFQPAPLFQEPAAPEPTEPAPAPIAEVPAAASEPATERPEAKPTGRALADLYYAQGHYAEALQIYDDLVTRQPFDEGLMRMRRDAEARLLPAGSSPAAVVRDPGFDRRMAQIRALKQWLAVVQAG